MGEIKIKSGNLFDINGEHTSLVWDGKECLIIENDAIIVNQIRPGYMTGIYYGEVYKPGTYTFAMKQLAAQSDKTAISVVSSAPFAGGVYNDAYKAYTAALVKHDDTHYITIVVTEPTEIGFFINGYFSVNDKIHDIQLLEGTYTSETIPEYQPYFLNRPAHQVTNDQFVDIPTHHFINNRWQGELTSQSPLKFWADGEMLDWRVEGKTSGNLFDTSVYNNDTYRHNCTVTNTSNSVTIISTGTDPYSGDVFTAGTTIPAVARTMYMQVKPNTAYTIAMSSAPKCYITQIDAEHNSVSGFRITQNLFTFTTNSATRYIIIRLGDDTLQVGESRTFENIQLLEGSYTADTLPPYEPYGGVGDWDETEQRYKIPVTVNGVTTNLYANHQLMDGDSIDYATDQTVIPIATGNNVLTVDTAVQPKSVFVKFEG